MPHPLEPTPQHQVIIFLTETVSKIQIQRFEYLFKVFKVRSCYLSRNGTHNQSSPADYETDPVRQTLDFSLSPTHPNKFTLVLFHENKLTCQTRIRRN